MVKLAITGCIGSGKTVVANALHIMGVPVYDCDSRAKSLMVNNPYIIKELVRMFGNECYCESGALNAGYLASRIFTDSANVGRVNALVHPIVIKDFLSWAEQQTTPVIAVETALLYESGLIETVDKVLVVWAPKEVAIARTMSRSAMSREQVLARMQKQMPADELILLSDYSICNDGDKPLLPELSALLKELGAS